MPPLGVYSITVPRTEVPVDLVARTTEFTVDVQNVQSIADRVVLDIDSVTPTPGPVTPPPSPAVPAWFAVEDHLRPIPAGGSEQFLITATVPATVPPGSYLMQPVAYSADHPPDDTKVAGPVMTLVVPAPPPPKPPSFWKKYWPWWLIAAIAAVLLVVAVVVVIVVLSGGGNKNTVLIPGTSGLSAATATSNLQALGLKVTQETRLSPVTSFGLALGTSPAAGTKVPPGSNVTLFVGGIPRVPISIPRFTIPKVTAAGPGGAPGAAKLAMVGWSPGPAAGDRPPPEST
jgi:hypothetical protein